MQRVFTISILLEVSEQGHFLLSCSASLSSTQNQLCPIYCLLLNTVPFFGTTMGNTNTGNVPKTVREKSHAIDLART